MQITSKLKVRIKWNFELTVSNQYKERYLLSCYIMAQAQFAKNNNPWPLHINAEHLEAILCTATVISSGCRIG